ncbi:hypothetical protein MtrunA17_Chr1g0168991 [Medicago truncatula]|uniref:Uncharacterized protein n=1 Tax=Medicago truncatula TaxID=3880 RepID=A0A396JVI9_MEDTR|nr:hypothetical protein MtrunA17_Chr1g0168991 [Medicago truncatula]
MRFKSVVKVTQNCRNWRMLSISVAELDSSVAEFALSDVGTFEKDRKNVVAEETPKIASIFLLLTLKKVTLMQP